MLLYVCSYDGGQEQVTGERRQFFTPVYYHFSILSSVIVLDQHFVMLMCSAILALVNSYYKCAAITGLCDDLYLVASDFVISKCLPKESLLTYYNSCTVIICLVQLIRTAVFCGNVLDLDLDTEHYFMCYLLLLAVYGYKLYLLVSLLQRFSVQLNAFLQLHDEGSILIFALPIIIAYYRQQPMHWIDCKSGDLTILKMVIEKLEKIFLKRRNEVLADSSSDRKVHYDDSMDITAMYFSTKEQLQQCRGDYEELTDEHKRYRKNVEYKRKELEKQLNTLEKDLTKLKETKENIKQLQCCICHDKQPNILLRPCNHLSLCEGCTTRMKKNSCCPLCRRKIKETIKVFS